jgi:YggT family protein
MLELTIANLISGVAVVLKSILSIYMWIIIIRAVLSWVNPDPNNNIVRILYQVTEPVLYAVRKRLPYTGGLDLSPIAVLLAIMFLQVFLVGTLMDLARNMR